MLLDSDGEPLATDRISVILNDEAIKPEITIRPPDAIPIPCSLKTGKIKISITVSDDTGLSTNYAYTVYHTTGPVTVTMSLEATTLSKMLISPCIGTVRQCKTALLRPHFLPFR